jgi:predicted O-linked N-acetylglucosamine transferase (SPINDLY family)
VDAYDPSVVLSFGDWEMVGDLLSRRYPVVHVPLAAGPAMSLGHVYLHTGEEEAAAELLDGQRGEYRCADFMPWVPPAAETALKRSDLEIPDDAFCYAVVGNRLAHEIDGPFAIAIQTLLEAHSRARIVVIGADYGGEIEAHLPDHLEGRVTPIPFQEDLMGVYGLWDAYLNPFRVGGGMSAFMAVRAGLPIITLGDCDVATVCQLGSSLSCEDHAAYIAHAIRLLDDEAYRLGFCEATEDKARHRPLLFDAPEELESICQQAIQRFEEINRQSV